MPKNNLDRLPSGVLLARSHPWRWLSVTVCFTLVMACAFLPTPQPTASAPAPTPAASASPVASMSPQPTAAPANATQPASADTAFGAVLAKIGPNGEVTPEMALEAFALAVAPLPGVTPPAGPPGDLDADLAVAWVSQVRDQLSPAQQAAIDAALKPFSDPRRAGGHAPAALSPQAAALVPDCHEFSGPPAPAPTWDPGIHNPPLLDHLADMMYAAASSIASHLGRPPLLGFGLCFSDPTDLSGVSVSRVYDSHGLQVGPPDFCTLFFNRDKVADLTDLDLGYIVAAKTFLCFIPTAPPVETLATYYAHPPADWVWDGASAWVGATLGAELFGGACPCLQKVWASYLTQPQVSLYRRTLDAIGFFSQIDQDHPTAWNVIDKIVTARDTLDAFHAATGRRQSFTNLWAAGYFRDASLGPDWDIAGPGITGDRAKPKKLTLANGQSLDLLAPELAVATAELAISADVTEITARHLRVNDGAKDLTEIANGNYCTKGGSDACLCPQGTPGADLPPLPPLNKQVKLAMAGIETAIDATIAGLSLKDYCGTPGNVWSLVFWSPDLGTTAPPLLAAYTCNGLVSTWKVLSLAIMEKTFELPFATSLTVHQNFHFDLPPDKQSPAQGLDYSLDFTLNPNAKPPVLTTSGTKTLTQASGQTNVYNAFVEFGDKAPMVLQNVSLETQLKPYPKYQHPFRAQALKECGQ